MAIAQAESGCRADAIGYNTNGTNDVGVFQINSVHVPNLITDKARLDPVKNVAAAYAIYSSSGWSAWSAYNNQSYLKYL